ncbi:hypothetical protein [Sphingobacterium zeae]|uniref:CHAT domain-containing protein n=1 Tax=Sphingobacterium zeae TaxID=1776859 RepID=A0ABU0U6N6_9SPHI|nr:hypothetical protein [Sphingobacterium zeae]MDQ1150489.1 hypothetical protein [Sphingobacterium zeae]
MQFQLPKIRKDFILVVNYDKPDLVAAILSYLYVENEYLPIFSFHNVSIAKTTPVIRHDPYVIQRRNANQFNKFLEDAIEGNGGCDTLIYVGLTPNQLSFLNVHNIYPTIELDDMGDIPTYLGGYGIDKTGELICSEGQLGNGLIHALTDNQILSVDNIAVVIDNISQEGFEGVVLIEDYPNSDKVVAINYALSVNAWPLLIAPLEDREDEEILYLLEQWNSTKASGRDILLDKISRRINHIDFSNLSFATFFTRGLPYPLLVTEIPASMVNLIMRPDFFIFNALIAETKTQLGSAAIFSPSIFKDEETDDLINLLEFENYYQRKMIGKSATTYNLKNTIESYPFGLMHICSHGGNVKGRDCELVFRGIDGIVHKIEFKLVLSIAFSPFEDSHHVETVYYFRKLDNLFWRSDELKAKGYSHEFYASLSTIISQAFDKKLVVQSKEKVDVPNSRSIQCYNNWNYLANFNQFSSPLIYPFIFNNTCWSWSKVSTSFLVCGCRAYIGTLKEVKNTFAVKFAQIFYDNVFSTNIINAFHLANQAYLAYNDYSVYIFWGLHLSTLKNRQPVNTNKTAVLKHISGNFNYLKRKLEEVRFYKDKSDLKDISWLLMDVLKSDTNHIPRSSP